MRSMAQYPIFFHIWGEVFISPVGVPYEKALDFDHVNKFKNRKPVIERKLN